MCLVKLCNAKMLNLRRLVRRPLKDVQLTDLSGDLKACFSCLRPYRSNRKRPCPFCKIVGDSPRELVGLPVDETAKRVLWGSRRLEFVEQVLGTAARDEMGNRVLEHAKAYVRTADACCKTENLRERLRHVNHRDANIFLHQLALACFRAVVASGSTLTQSDSLLYDKIVDTQPGRPVCALCRVETSLLGSHIISKSLLMLGGNYVPALQPRISGGYDGEAAVVHVLKHTERLCCRGCEDIFTNFGENFFGEAFRTFVDSFDRSSILQRCDFECVCNADGASSIFHTIVGIACRSFLSFSTDVRPKVGGDLNTLKASAARLRVALRAGMLASGDKNRFRQASKDIAVRCLLSKCFLEENTLKRPLFALNRAIGGGADLALVHISIQGVHFVVVHADDLQKLFNINFFADACVKDRLLTVDVDTTRLDFNLCGGGEMLHETFPMLLDHDVEIYNDHLRAFALSLLRDRAESLLGAGHPALLAIPEASDDILGDKGLECPLVRLPQSFKCRVPIYIEPRCMHHPVVIQGNGTRSSVCHVHRMTFAVIDGTQSWVNVYLCIDNGNIVVVLDVDMTKAVGQRQNVSHLRPRIIFAVKIANPRFMNRIEADSSLLALNLPFSGSVGAIRVLDPPRVVFWDITPWRENYHEDLFAWNNYKFRSLGDGLNGLPMAAVDSMLNHTMFRARLHQQKFPSVDYTLLPLPEDMWEQFSQYFSSVDEQKLIDRGNEALTSDALLISMK